MMHNDTPLTRALTQQEAKVQATPLDALKLARKHWLEHSRLNMGSLAEELGVNRATLFRWVGNKDLLLGEVLWSFYRVLFDQIIEDAEGEGGEYLAWACEQVVVRIMENEPLQRFIRQDTEYAIRILTSKSSIIQGRSIEVIRGLLQSEADAGRWRSPIPLAELAYLIVRVGESFLYGDIISGHDTAMPHARTAFRLLLGAQQPAP
ncbi:QsdR family transcriptional regulator [Alloalcanivorax xenomutans]|jgi:AcrR family transcriptional regulator|uniref:QsdR family transcriptional regulator n=1 Tax=Alloalcanivorax xenomutans TaxID=1094342 RepID=UPI0003B8E6F0|nr:hypothetical protein Q668_14080 [Alcanivorax sp. PN-3]